MEVPAAAWAAVLELVIPQIWVYEKSWQALGKVKELPSVKKNPASGGPDKIQILCSLHPHLNFICLSKRLGIFSCGEYCGSFCGLEGNTAAGTP